MIVLLLVVALAPVGALSVRLPTLADLTRAARTNDPVALERVAARLGVVRLERIAERGTRAERMAALRAIPLEHDAWAVLPDLVALASSSEFELAEAAGRTVRQIAEGLTPEVALSEEVPPDVPRRAARALGALAAHEDLTPSVRVSALEALAALRAITRIDDASIARLLSSGEPQVRRAAAEALDGAPGGDPALAQALASDPAVTVAAAAGAALCREVPPAPTTARLKKGAPPVAPTMPDAQARKAEARAARLSPAARARLRALAIDRSVSLADRLDLLACLRVAPSPEDRRVLDELARRGPESLRRRARSLGGR